MIAGTIGFLEEHMGLDAAGKGWAASAALVGCIVGAAMAGALSDRAGRKRILILSGLRRQILQPAITILEYTGPLLCCRHS